MRQAARSANAASPPEYDVPDGCDDHVPGTHIRAVVEATQGAFQSVCTYYFEGLFEDVLRHHRALGRQVELSPTPVEATLAVQVNGEALDAYFAATSCE